MSQFLVLAKPHPLRSETVCAHFDVGSRISDVVGDVGDDTVSVSIEGEYIPRAMWERMRPKAGTQITIARYPQGKTVKKIIVIVLLVLIYIFAPYIAPYLQGLGMSVLASQVVAGIITMVAVMAVTALIPPPELPKMGSDSQGAEFNRLNAITGTSNQATPYGTIPMVIGQCRFYPTFASNPYTEILGDQQYLRMLLDLGYGDLEISDIKIGETSIDTFDNVEYEISTAPDLFTDDVFELSLSDAFNQGASVQKTTQTLTDEISLDIVFPQGLFAVDKTNKTLLATTTITLSYRAVGAGTWINVASSGVGVTTSTSACQKMASNFQVQSSAKKLMRLGIRWKVPSGQYEILATRGGTSYSGLPAASFDTAQLTALRSIKHTNPSKTGTLKLAVRIKATDQLNGVINQLSVLAQQKIPVYDSTTHTWSAPTVNFNPAWIYYWLLNSCPGMARTVDASRIDLPAFEAWAADCVAKNFTCMGILDRAISGGELFKMVLAAGRAAFAMKDGKYSAIYDRDTLVPIQHFTPANSSGFSGQRVFIDMPHAIRAQFQNPALNWQQDEIVVLDDDHSYNGKNARGLASALPPAEKFETIAFPYATDPIAVWQLARFHMAQAIYRPNVYTWTADAEHLVCTRGDLVFVNHDVTDWGNGFGLVSTTVDGGGLTTKIITAEPFNPVAGKTHTIRVRSQDGSTYISNISAFGGGVVGDGPEMCPELTAPVWVGTGTVPPVQQIDGILFSGVNANDMMYFPVDTKDNTTYKGEIEIADYVDGSVRLVVYGDTGAHAASSANFSGNGVHSFTVSTVGTGTFNNRIAIQARGTGTTNHYKVVKASVQEVGVTQDYTEFTLSTPMPATVDTGDMYMLGTTDVATKQLLITKIEPGQDLTASLQAVEYSAAAQAFDNDPPSVFISEISGTKILEPPPPPVIYAVSSDPLLRIGGGFGGGGGGLGGDGGGGSSDADLGIGLMSGYYNMDPFRLRNLQGIA